jgi:hypothetical protein
VIVCIPEDAVHETISGPYWAPIVAGILGLSQARSLRLLREQIQLAFSPGGLSRISSPLIMREIPVRAAAS